MAKKTSVPKSEPRAPKIHSTSSVPKAPKSDYSAAQIQVLEGLEPVRKRPAMYIGSTDTMGLHESLREIIDNSVDEALAGFAKNIWIVCNVS